MKVAQGLLLWLSLGPLAQAGVPGETPATETDRVPPAAVERPLESTLSDPAEDEAGARPLMESLGIDGEPVVPLKTLLESEAGSHLSDEPRYSDRIRWNKTPIRLTLPAGQERLVHFPAPVRVGLPPELESRLRTQSAAGTVYWRALEPFATHRVQVREIESGRTYLFDLQARKDAPAKPVTILHPEAEKTDPNTPPASSQTEAHPNLDYVALTRFAARQLYAPSRLRQTLPGVTRIPLTAGEVPLVRGGQVQALPLIAWRGGDLFVTAVRLRNRTPRPVVLDPRDLRGSWQTATFQHARLLPAGDEADTTCVYLVSKRPFEDAFGRVF